MRKSGCALSATKESATANAPQYRLEVTGEPEQIHSIDDLIGPSEPIEGGYRWLLYTPDGVQRAQRWLRKRCDAGVQIRVFDASGCAVTLPDAATFRPPPGVGFQLPRGCRPAKQPRGRRAPKINTLEPSFLRDSRVPDAPVLERAEDLRIVEHNRAAGELAFKAAVIEMATWVARRHVRERATPPGAS